MAAGTACSAGTQMSLINEALRKARKESGADDGVRLSVSTSAHGPARNGAGTTLVLGAVIAAIAAIGGAGAVWWLLADRQLLTNPSTNTEISDVVEEVTIANDAPLAVHDRKTGMPEKTDSEENPLETTIVPSTDDPKVSAEAANEARPTPITPAKNIRDFFAEADLKDTKLKLDYIVFRANDPYAEINETEVHVGHHIEGFVVEEITRDLVRLSDKNGSLILRAR
jgi:hypothetical protein